MGIHWGCIRSPRKSEFAWGDENLAWGWQNVQTVAWGRPMYDACLDFDHILRGYDFLNNLLGTVVFRVLFASGILSRFLPWVYAWN